ncbi:L-cysteine desulfidase family protein [Isachenkonia alkalipeptolytica]|uniref:UPF0597 protein ISALK_06155 n=1 Tax=Isachenkonia alkalipeptolytica TaxID=2565777 RepID=A0AA43XKL4_9CLOT|nr:L-serine ammonia-lyase, iron-sulfur-dependent, subunit alpha [Isachenkonia alkalipeptolytica]NBG88081.1 serine dehydratase subunit alpha family protein [Isachenkonia alkalipeptolytica]
MEKMIIDMLKEEIRPAVGCTEPVAVAYGAALAKELLGEDLEELKILVNSNLYKNGMGVFVPGTTKKGLRWAAVLGALLGNPDKELEVLENLPLESETLGREFLDKHRVTVNYLEKKPEVFIEVKAFGNQSHSRVIIEKTHGNVVLKEKNGDKIYVKENKGEKEQPREFLRRDLDIEGLRGSVKKLTKEDLSFLNPVIEKNCHIGNEGKKIKLGMGVGYSLTRLMEEGKIGEDALNKAKAITAGASDARMSGASYTVYSCAGSGNQGLAASLPVIVMAEELNLGEETLLQGLALSFMVTIYVKNRIGRLSPLCGCGIAAGVGSAVALGEFMDMSTEEIEKGIQNIIGNLTGMICDGAKPGCALKLSTSVGGVMEMMLLAKAGACISESEGITGKTLQKSIENLGALSTKGMESADDLILQLMVAQNP